MVQGIAIAITQGEFDGDIGEVGAILLLFPVPLFIVGVRLLERIVAGVEQHF